jgi:Arc/MetJ-type ribon-helix-helix transcriptional regulator
MVTENTAQDEIRAWFAGRLPDEWFTGPAEISVDREEILVVGTLADPDVAQDADEAACASAAGGRISRWREQTREDRIGIAQSAEHRFGRKVAWGAKCHSTSTPFTHLAVPVMTRLRQPERQVLDTLVESGVARSRSEALAWSVRLVGQHTEDWLAELRTAMASVDEVRARGPQTT